MSDRVTSEEMDDGNCETPGSIVNEMLEENAGDNEMTDDGNTCENEDDGNTCENEDRSIVDGESYASRAARTVSFGERPRRTAPASNENSMPQQPKSAFFTPSRTTTARSVFDALVNADIDHTEIHCLQRKLNGEVVVTFKSIVAKEKFLRLNSLHVNSENYALQDIDKPLTFLTIYDAPFELSDLAIIKRLAFARSSIVDGENIPSHQISITGCDTIAFAYLNPFPIIYGSANIKSILNTPAKFLLAESATFPATSAMYARIKYALIVKTSAMKPETVICRLSAAYVNRKDIAASAAIIPGFFRAPGALLQMRTAMWLSNHQTTA